MLKTLLSCAFLLCVHLAFAQSFKGIIYGTDDVLDNAVIQNLTKSTFAVSDREGSFAIRAAINDSIKIAAAFYTSQFIVIEPKHLNETWVIELKESLNELDEVRIQDSIKEVVFDAGVETKKLQETIQSDYEKHPEKYTPGRITGGIDIISLTGKLIKLIRGKRKKKNKEETIPPSSYKDFKNLFEEDNIFTNELLTEELGIPLAYKSLFFDYLDGQAIPSDLRKEENHFQLLDRLFTESENFKILIETAKKEGED
tara:strand:- start:346 stop:1113 length:768 start_codon:yes stop_codon:yes gene_type:complete